MNLVKQRPILFSAPMVNALLAGTKTQTRRIVNLGNAHPDRQDLQPEVLRIEQLQLFSGTNEHIGQLHCPYGKPGDVLWVRETLYLDQEENWRYKADHQPVLTDQAIEVEAIVWAHHKETEHCSSIHMPKFACRLYLEITSVRVERLLDITEADALAEGVERTSVVSYTDGIPTHGVRYQDYLQRHDLNHPLHKWAYTAKYSFETLWKKINGRDSWAANPWVWVVEFKRVEKPVLAAKEVAHA